MSADATCTSSSQATTSSSMNVEPSLTIANDPTIPSPLPGESVNINIQSLHDSLVLPDGTWKDVSAQPLTEIHLCKIVGGFMILQK